MKANMKRESFMIYDNLKCYQKLKSVVNTIVYEKFKIEILKLMSKSHKVNVKSTFFDARQVYIRNR